MRDAHAKAVSGMVSEIADLPLSGAGTYANVAGLRSRKMTEGGLGIPEKTLTPALAPTLILTLPLTLTLTLTLDPTPEP